MFLFEWVWGKDLVPERIIKSLYFIIKVFTETTSDSCDQIHEKGKVCEGQNYF